MLTLMTDLGGTGDLTLSSGAISDTWGPDMLTVLHTVSTLPEWSVVAAGNDVQITGVTDDPARQEALNTSFNAANMLPGLNGNADITLRVPILPATALTPILQEVADCGPLELAGAPAPGYSSDATVTVSGNVASDATQTALSEALAVAIGTRTLALDTEVLNPTLCLIADVLPAVAPGSVQIDLLNGADGSVSPDGRFTVGDNPVIDIVIPADMTEGYLFISAVDVSGNVFHLLPNLFRAENSVAALRDGASGAVTLRVAYPLADAADGSKLAFDVDDSTLGKTQIVAINADSQMFGGLRPTTESAGGYAQALKDRSGTVRSLDSRTLPPSHRDPTWIANWQSDQKCK